MRKTRIMATVADHRCDAGFLANLRGAGMDAVRINSAHVTPDELRRMVKVIRDADSAIQILMDTKGPEIRTTEVAADLTLATGASCSVVSSEEPSTAERICLRVDDIHLFMQPGYRMLLDDGAIELAVEATTSDAVLAKVTRGGVLGSRKTVSIPDVEVPPLPAVSERDRVNIAAGVELGIDMIAHSFVRTIKDIEAVRELIAGSGIMLYSKIECREALQNFEEIMEASDGILVARGDLGAQVAMDRIPAIQHYVLGECRARRKPAILSTQILQSMLEHPYPTRAEVNDIGVAVMEGADMLLLTGETAQGRYPAECVEVMRRTIESTEQYMNTWRLD